MSIALVLTLQLAAAESDPYFAWRGAPRDSAVALDRAVNGSLREGLRATHRNMTCREAMQVTTAALAATAQYYFIGPVRRWRVDVVPRDEAGSAALERHSVYRHAPLFPFGHAVPLDPTMNANGVLFGTDKLGHFFTNGLRAYDVFHALPATERDRATRAVVEAGIEEERGWLGMGVCGIFSYADIHANLAGLRFYRSLCDEGGLVLDDTGQWHLTRPFRIADYVDPCWDESWTPSAFAERERPAIDAALLEVCPLLRDANVQTRREAYAQRGCARESTAAIAALVAEGAAPDASRWSIDAVCAGR